MCEEDRMENARLFGELTSRMREFRDETLSEKPFVDAERAVLATESYREHQASRP